MSKIKALIAAFLMSFSASASATAQDSTNGLVTKKSNHSVAETLDRLGEAVTNGGGKIFARVNHAMGAKSIGSDLRPTEMILFGNPKLGTPAMNAAQTMGLDLPLRALAWQDENGDVFLTYHLPKSVGKAHGLAMNNAVLEKMTTVLDNLSNHATK